MRIDYGKVMPEARDAMIRLQGVADTAGLEPRLVELVKIRASQLNGCAYCLDMHTKDARAIGEDEQRLHLLAASTVPGLPADGVPPFAGLLLLPLLLLGAGLALLAQPRLHGSHSSWPRRRTWSRRRSKILRHGG